jgi:hypothetical protein
MTLRSRLRTRLFGLLILTIAIYSGELSAKTVYVSTAGHDFNAGTLSNPYATIRKGISVLRSGDTLYLRGGRYVESFDPYSQVLPNGTSWATATTISAYPGETATLVGSVVLSNQAYLIFDGINIDGSSNGHDMANFFINGSNHIRLTNAEIYNCQWSCISSDQSPTPGTFYEFTNLKIHDSGRQGATPTGPSHGIYLSGRGSAVGGPVLIENCLIYNNVSDPNSYGITIYTGAKDTLANITISNNVIRNNSYGMQIGQGNNHLVFNNVIKDNVGLGVEVAFGAPDNIRIYGNLIYGNGWHGIIVGDYGSPTNTLIKDNIIGRNGGNAVQLAGGVGSIVQSNVSYGNASGNTTSKPAGFVKDTAEHSHFR